MLIHRAKTTIDAESLDEEIDHQKKKDFRELDTVTWRTSTTLFCDRDHKNTRSQKM
jgi:hypothetical protein